MNSSASAIRRRVARVRAAPSLTVSLIGCTLTLELNYNESGWGSRGEDRRRPSREAAGERCGPQPSLVRAGSRLRARYLARTWPTSDAAAGASRSSRFGVEAMTKASLRIDRLTDPDAVANVEPLLREYLAWVVAQFATLAADLADDDALIATHHAMFVAEVP